MNVIRRIFILPWIYVIIVIVGIFLKFYKIDSKLFWDDEVATVLQTSGIKFDKSINLIPLNEIRHKSFYDSLLHLNSQPNTITSQVKGIFNDTNITPLHYVFLAIWNRIAGDDTMNYRYFSVFIFIISLPFLFLLAKNLFKSSLSGWIAISLYSVSPFINLYSQESRYYILWGFFFLVCNYFFVQGIKHSKNIWWIAYSIAAILALYTSILSGTFILGHFLYVMFLKKEQRITFCIFLAFVALAYMPWFYYLFTMRANISKGLAWQVAGSDYNPFFVTLYFQLIGLLKYFVFLYDIYFYPWLWYDGWHSEMFYPFLFDVAVLSFIIYAILYLIKKTPGEIKWFLVLIIVPLMLFLYIEDIIRNSFTSVNLRYQIISMASIGLIATNLLYNKIIKGKILFMGIFVVLISLGVSSIITIAYNRCWIARDDCYSNIEDAHIFSQAKHPLIITDLNPKFAFGLSNFITVLNEAKSPNIDLLYTNKYTIDKTDSINLKIYSDIFVYQSSDSLVKSLQAQFGRKMVLYKNQDDNRPVKLWQINL